MLISVESNQLEIVMEVLSYQWQSIVCVYVIKVIPNLTFVISKQTKITTNFLDQNKDL